ncbi:N-6 DNA methylase [Actinokineospora iranica]|nr:N-6 DNA methylase [Actinokineospora iranica]
MNPDAPVSADTLVTAADIARSAKITRAAVSNWRKRYPDFPAPASGAGRNARFSAAEVTAWLERHGRGQAPSSEVLIWQALRSAYGEDLVAGLADTAELLGNSADSLAQDLRSLVSELAAQSSPAEVVSGLVERFLSSPSRTGLEQTSTARLGLAMRQFAGDVSGVVFDPACGFGTLLLAFGEDAKITLVGQEINPDATRLTQARLALAGRDDATVRTGDSLRDDQWPQLQADLVVCDPPTNTADWGREDLLLDARWEFGVPTRAESELAWLQHCYAHTAPGGRAIVVQPPSVAYRKAGRRIRAELVRRGVLTHVVALPAGMAASHPLPVQLWLLARPKGSEQANSVVRMVDMANADPAGPFEPDSRHCVDVPLIDLLDEEVDLTPTRYVTASVGDHLAEYQSACAELASRLQQIGDLLPALAAGPGSLEGATLKVADLVRAGLVSIENGSATSASDQLDTDYLRGFLHSSANVKRATSGSGTFRVDVRGSRIPQMGIGDQHRYGAAFRALEEFERRLAALTKLGERASRLARDGLTQGALRPKTGVDQ